ncbi:hypothetical protein ACFLZ1_05430, partial [Patescibacteria group bacterium]
EVQLRLLKDRKDDKDQGWLRSVLQFRSEVATDHGTDTEQLDVRLKDIQKGAYEIIDIANRRDELLGGEEPAQMPKLEAEFSRQEAIIMKDFKLTPEILSLQLEIIDLLDKKQNEKEKEN